MFKKDLEDHQKLTGVLGPTILSDFPGVRLGLEGTVPIDTMHLLRNILVHIMQCLTGEPSKTGLTVMQAERDRGGFLDLWPEETEEHPLDVPWQLSREETKTADNRALSLCLPLGFGLKPAPFFSQHDRICRCSDWLEMVSTGILKYCLRGLLGQEQRRVIFRLFDCLRSLVAPAHSEEDLDSLESFIATTLAEPELHFPVSMQVMMIHLLHHSVSSLRKYGIVYSTWMFGSERVMAIASKRATNKRYPEATIMETVAMYSSCVLRRLDLPKGSATVDIDPLHPRETFLSVLSDTEVTYDEYKNQYEEFIRQRVTGRQLGNLYGESQTDCLSPEEYGDLVDFFRIYHREFGEIALLYESEKDMSNDPTFPAMRDWMPLSHSHISDDRIGLLRHGPNIQFRSFRRAVVPDVDIPGRMLHIRPLGAQPRDMPLVTDSSWVAVLFRHPSTGEREPHLLHHPTTLDEDPIFLYFARMLRLGEVNLLVDEPMQVAEVVWAKRARLDKETCLWVLDMVEENISREERYVPVDDLIPVAVAIDNQQLWILNFRAARQVDACLRAVR